MNSSRPAGERLGVLLETDEPLRRVGQLDVRLGRFRKKSAAFLLVSTLVSATITSKRALARRQSLSKVMTTGTSCHTNGNSDV